MQVVLVHVHVKSDGVDAFKAASAANAVNSLREPGIARFDLLQDATDPTRFVLVEAYRTTQAMADHKATAHYAAWRDTVAPMMAEPRASTKCVAAFPPDDAW